MKTNTLLNTLTPTYNDILDAQKRILPYLSPTPLHYYSLLSELLGTDTWVKHENHQPVGAFKVRGGINLIYKMSLEERKKGVIAASTGNHAQSIAYAGKIFNVKATIVMPENSNPEKVSALNSLGAEIIFYGKDFDEARKYVEQIAPQKGYRYINSGDEPDLIAGVATYTLEILEKLPDTEIIIVPIGGGSGAAGCCLVAKTINPSIKIIGVQAKNAPSAYLTWKNRAYTEATTTTFAEGVATRTPFMLPQSILWKYLDDFILLEDEDILKCIRLYYENTHNIAEGAAATTLAAALQIKDKLQGKKTVLLMSGGNLSIENLKLAFNKTFNEHK